MKQECQCGQVLTGYRVPDYAQTGEGIRPAGRQEPHVWAATRADAWRGWDGRIADPRPLPTHDVLTGGPAAELMMLGACRKAQEARP